MVFSSKIFLFIFLTSVLSVYFLGGIRWRNYVLLVASLIFYAWGESVFVLLMLFSIAFNYGFGLLIHFAQEHSKKGTIFLFLALVFNIGLLAFFKYANFLVSNINILLAFLQIAPIQLAPIHLPIGISFFTFQAMSYILDLYRQEVKVQKNPVNIALYIALFPQLIAGPIVRYHDIAKQIIDRVVRADDFNYGVKRFIIGLGKKVLIANIVGRVADHIFTLPVAILPATLAWLGIISFTIQIYFDFSGYSDMAIGLGRIFGFRFRENFLHPYISRSIREFWRRWHISLSTWFRDYLYIPLGGSRGGEGRTYFNLVTVFFLCGLWHGANLTFIVWGLFHGVFLILERSAFGNFIKRLPNALRYLYAITVVLVGWVFFRSQTLIGALNYLQAMVNFDTPPYFDSHLFLYMNSEFYLALLCGIIGSTPVFSFVSTSVDRIILSSSSGLATIIRLSSRVGGFLFLAFVFLYSISSILGGMHRPFLYFRF